MIWNNNLCPYYFFPTTSAAEHWSPMRNCASEIALPPSLFELWWTSRLSGTTRCSLRRVTAALRAAHHNSRCLLDRLDRRGKIRLRAHVADHGYPQTPDRFGDFHRQSERLHLLQAQPHVLHHQAGG